MARNTYAAEIREIFAGLNQRQRTKKDDAYRQKALAETIRNNRSIEKVALERLAQSERNIRVQGGVTSGHIDKKGAWQSEHITDDYIGKAGLLTQRLENDRNLRHLDFSLGSQTDMNRDRLSRGILGIKNRYKTDQMRLSGDIENNLINARGGWDLSNIKSRGQEDRTTQGQRYDLMKDFNKAEYVNKKFLQDENWESKAAYDQTQSDNKVSMAKELAEFSEEGVVANDVTRKMLIESGVMPKEWDGTIPRGMRSSINQGAFGLMGYQSMYDKELAKATAKIETAAPLIEPAHFDQLDDAFFTNEDDTMGSIQVSLDSFSNATASGVTGAEKLKRDPSGAWSKSKMTDLKNIYQGLNNPSLQRSGWFELTNNSQAVDRHRARTLELMKINWEARGWTNEQIAKETSGMDKQYYDGKKHYDVRSKASAKSKTNPEITRRISSLNSQIARHAAKGDTTSAQYNYKIEKLNELLARQGK